VYTQFLEHNEGAMNNSIVTKYSGGSNRVSAKTISAAGIAGWILALALALALQFPGLGFGTEAPDPPSGQPTQMWSKVDYDPKLADPFFDSNEWSCPDGCTICQEGEQPLKHTARCFSNSFGRKHLVRFCEARLLDVNMIDLFILESSPAYEDALIVQIRNGRFTTRYKTVYRHDPRDVGLVWTTKRQELTLDKKVYQKGDVIKGRINFECLQEIGNPKYAEKAGSSPKYIKLYGVFKTIIE
jgi:hypothetical protein